MQPFLSVRDAEGVVRGMTERGAAPGAQTLREHRTSAVPVPLLHGHGRRRDGPEDGDRQRHDDPAGQGHHGQSGDEQEGSGGIEHGTTAARASRARQESPGDQSAAARIPATMRPISANSPTAPTNGPPGIPARAAWTSTQTAATAAHPTSPATQPPRMAERKSATNSRQPPPSWAVRRRRCRAPAAKAAG